MLVADLILGVSLLPLLLVTSSEWLWLIVVVLVFESAVFQFYRPAEGALVPTLVPQRELLTANALNGLSMNVARLAGPPLGAFLVALSGLSGVVVLDAASFLLGALTLLLVKLEPRCVVTSASRARSAVWRQWLDGLHVVRTQPLPRLTFLFLALAGLGEGVISTLFVAFATRVVQGGEMAYGALISAQAVGGIAGGALIGHFSRRSAPGMLLGVGASLVGAIDFLIFYSPLVTSQVLVPIALMVVVGIPVAALMTGYLTLAQTSVDDAYRGRLLCLFFATMALSGLVGMAIAGLLGDAVGIIPMLTLQCLAYLFGGAMVLICIRRMRTRALRRRTPGADGLAAP
jgi:predicted MFS family arabinose efflux permease